MTLDRPRGSRRRWGYFLWGVALGVVFVPEVLAASAAIDRHMPFTTISGMTGHIEYLHSWVELFTVAAIVFVLVSIRRLPPDRSSGGHDVADDKPHRTAGGRTTFRLGDDSRRERNEFDSGEAPFWFGVAALGACVLIAVSTWAVYRWWGDPAGHTQWRTSYFLYGSIAAVWIVIPSLVAFVAGRDVPFPTLFRTLDNLETWLRRQRFHRAVWLGPVLAWLLGFVVVWGLVVLLLHLTLYPFPDITHVLNPGGG
jgi:hypothetical protein